MLSFVDLILVVRLFRDGDDSAMIAAIFYAATPAVRYTADGIRQGSAACAVGPFGCRFTA